MTARTARAVLAAGIRAHSPPAQLALPRPSPPVVYGEPVRFLRPANCLPSRDPATGRPLRTRDGRLLELHDGRLLELHDWRDVKPGWLQCCRCGQWAPA